MSDIKELEEKVRKKIKEAFEKKDYDTVAKLGVAMAFAKIDPKELLKVLQDGIKEFKKLKEEK